VCLPTSSHMSRVVQCLELPSRMLVDGSEFSVISVISVFKAGSQFAVHPLTFDVYEPYPMPYIEWPWVHAADR